MKKFLGPVLSCILSLSSNACAANSTIGEDKVWLLQELNYPALANLMIIDAYSQFTSEKVDVSCFSTILGWNKDDSYFYVLFLQTDTANDLSSVGGGNKCGPAVSYRYDSNYKFIEKIYQR